MSLKAKIEAVIYASEEPVTLAQLVGLLGQEAQVGAGPAGGARQQRLHLAGDEGGEPEATAQEPEAQLAEETLIAEPAGEAAESAE